MTLSEVADISQAVAAVAVLASLIALILETRQNTKALRAGAVWDAQLSFAAINERLADGGPLSEVSFKAFTEPQSLTAYERHLFHRYTRSVLQRMEAQFAMHQSGVLHDEVWQIRRAYLKSLLDHPLLAAIWKLEKDNAILTRSFIAEIDAAASGEAPVFLDAGGRGDAAASV